MGRPNFSVSSEEESSESNLGSAEAAVLSALMSGTSSRPNQNVEDVVHLYYPGDGSGGEVLALNDTVSVPGSSGINMASLQAAGARTVTAGKSGDDSEEARTGASLTDLGEAFTESDGSDEEESDAKDNDASTDSGESDDSSDESDTGGR